MEEPPPQTFMGTNDREKVGVSYSSFRGLVQNASALLPDSPQEAFCARSNGLVNKSYQWVFSFTRGWETEISGGGKISKKWENIMSPDAIPSQSHLYSNLILLALLILPRHLLSVRTSVEEPFA